MDQTETGRLPASYWIVTGLSLLWNAFGGYDYTMTQTRNAEYLKNFPAEMIQMIDDFPVWATVCWALGVWGAVAGSLLLVLRSRFAVHAFAVSLLGLALSTVYQWQSGVLEKFGSPGMTAMNLIIWAAAIFFLWFSNRQARLGRLR